MVFVMDGGIAGAISAGGKRDLSVETDENLVRLHRTGTADALAELMRRYRGELYHYLVRFLGSRAAADDVFQETFVQIHVSADRFDVDKRFKPWLFTIGSNKARDYLRRNRRHRALPLDAGVEGRGGGEVAFVSLMESDLPMPSDVADRAEVGDLVRGVVDEMPDHLREVLVLAYFQKLAYKEIAEILEIPLGTVKSRLHAAVATFADVWKTRHGGLGSGQEDGQLENGSDASGAGA